jgi:formate dehydrogenase accessory protein FdhD
MRQLSSRRSKVPVIRYFGSPPPVDCDVGANGERWRVPEETPVALIYNERNYAVMLATPADLADFAVGFSLTERVVGALAEIEAIDIHQEELGVDIRVTLAARALERFDARQQRRNLVGRAGCGVCGVENAETFFERLPQVRASKAEFSRPALLRAARELERHQPLNASTRTVHAAAFASPEGEVLLAREDVGRHNALDKLVGAMALAPPLSANGFVVMSSRCSYEIVEKSSRAGVGAILSLSAPTAFAIKKAEEANIALFVISGGRVVAIER